MATKTDSPKLRLVFMGTPQFSVPVLRLLNEKHLILAVFCQPDKPVGRGLELSLCAVKKTALALDLRVYQPEKLSDPSQYEILKNLNPDAIVVVAYGQIIKQNVIDLPRLGCLNIHSSLLPRWRGAAPINWAILAGDQESGVTTMKIIPKLDAGDILLQEKTKISSTETASSLHDRLSEMGASLILKTLELLEDGSIQPQKQNEREVTHAAKLSKEMEELRPYEKTAIELDRQIRGLTPWPGTSVKLESGERIKIKSIQLRENVNESPGLLFEKNGMLLLSSTLGALEVLRLQPEGKKELSSADFLNGLKGKKVSLPLKVVR